MGWNEPNDNNRDPWGGRRNEQGPPDLDEVVRKLQDKLGGMFGRRPSGGSRHTAEPPASTWVIAVIALLALLGYEMFWRIDSAERGVVLPFRGRLKKSSRSTSSRFGALRSTPVC